MRSSVTGESPPTGEPQSVRYSYRRQIGAGAFSRIYLGDSTTTGPVALKVVSRSVPQEIEKARREIAVMRSCGAHPHLLQLYDVIDDDTNTITLVLQLAERDLCDLIMHHGPLSETEARRNLAMLVGGLQHMHSRGWCHRDIKPDNCLRMTSGELVLADFGLANYGGKGDSTLLKTPCGTDSYAAPEVIARRLYDGRRADIFSLGIVFHVMLTGSYPWERACAQDSSLYREHVAGRFQWSDRIPARSVELLLRMLHVNPAARASLEEVAQYCDATNQSHMKAGTVEPPPSRIADQAETIEMMEGTCRHSDNHDATAHDDTKAAPTKQTNSEEHTPAWLDVPGANVAVVKQHQQHSGHHARTSPQQPDTRGGTRDAQFCPVSELKQRSCPVADSTACGYTVQQHEIHKTGDTSMVSLGCLMLTVMLGAAFLVSAAELCMGEGLVIPPVLGFPHTPISATFLGATLAIAGLVPFAISLCHLVTVTNVNTVAMVRRLMVRSAHGSDSMV